MSKYIKKYNSLQNAKSDNSILSPNVSYITEGGGEKILYADLGDNKNLVITGDTIEGAEIKEKVTITYSSAHGTTPESKQVASGYALVSSDLPTLSESGWEFKGWDKSVGDVINTNTTITASWEEESQMGYFTVDNKKYYFNDPDMTLEDWCSSEYNTDNFACEDYEYCSEHSIGTTETHTLFKTSDNKYIDNFECSASMIMMCDLENLNIVSRNYITISVTEEYYGEGIGTIYIPYDDGEKFETLPSKSFFSKASGNTLVAYVDVYRGYLRSGSSYVLTTELYDSSKQYSLYLSD